MVLDIANNLEQHLIVIYPFSRFDVGDLRLLEVDNRLFLVMLRNTFDYKSDDVLQVLLYQLWH